MKLKRRTVLLASIAVAGVALVPFVKGGVQGFLARVLRTHFGSDVTEIDGVDSFVAEYASYVGRDNQTKRLGAGVYFAFRGEKIKKLGMSQDLEERFLRTILTNSNIIAIRQGRAKEFEFSGANPWEPVCGLYLSAAADEMN